MNRPFDEEIIPDIWKLANLVPIFKKGDKFQPSNYRPAALLSCIGKLQGLFIRVCIIFSLTVIFYTSINLISYLIMQQCFSLLTFFILYVELLIVVFCDLSKGFDRI